jgi:cytochrome bd ubiquinol oxidase subunit II
MDDLALLLSRLQFAFTISFHIIFPAFSIGLAAWLTVLEALHLWTRRPAYRVLFDFWLKIFGVAFGLGVVSGIVMAYGMRWLWNWSFAGGSFAASFIQGLTVGALVEGLPVANGQYAGGEFGWFSLFAVLCGVGLCIGYALLGACWLVKKSEGELRERAYRLVPYLAVGLLVFLVVVFAYALAENLRVLGRWLERPYLFIFPVIGALCVAVLAFSVRYRRDDLPFPMVVVIFVAAFGTLAISFWPYIIPFVLTVYEAAAPESSLAFMFWGEGLFIFPLLLLYTAINYSVFRGKVSPTDGHY